MSCIHYMQWVITCIAFSVIAPVFLLQIYLGGSCLLISKSDIGQCRSIELLHINIYSILTLLCIVQVIENFSVICIILKPATKAFYKLYSKTNKKQTIKLQCACLECKDSCTCNALSIYMFYWIPTITICGDAIYQFGYNSKNIPLTVFLSLSIIINTLKTMLVLPLSMLQYNDLVVSNNLLASITEVEHNFEEYDSIGTCDRKDLETCYVCCSYPYKPRYTWMPVSIYCNILINIGWFIYDITRFILLIDKVIPNLREYRLNLLFAFVAILYRYYHFSKLFTKSLIMDSM